MSFDPEWADKAKCRDWPARLWFSEPTSEDRGTYKAEKDRAMAKRICASCPVIRECLTSTLEREALASIPLGHASFYVKHKQGCGITEKSCGKDFCVTGGHIPSCDGKKCKGCAPKFVFKPFTASVMPPFGIYGGVSPEARNTKALKHYELVRGTKKSSWGWNVCARDPRCKGCRTVEERVDVLLEGVQ